MQKDFLGKRLMFVIAHPDDEAYLAAGTIFANKQSKGQTILVCATLGEKGKSHLQKSVTQAQLKLIRAKELKAVAKFLSMDKLCLLAMADCKLSKHSNSLLYRIRKLVKLHSPEIIISFGTDGITGHLDHIAVGAAAKKVAAEFKLPFVAFAAPPCFLKQTDATVPRRKHGVYSTAITYPKSNLKIKINPEIKTQVLLLHASQISQQDPFLNLPKLAGRQMLSFEYFIV